MSEEEKAQRLRDMQENAKWRNETRHKNVDKYKKDERLEEQMESMSKSEQMQEQATSLFK